MVRQKKLKAYRIATAGRHAPLWFSRTEIETLCNDPKRAKHRKGYEKARQTLHLRYQHRSEKLPEWLQPLPRRPKKLPADWLTTREAAKRLGVSSSRVRDMIHAKRLKGMHRWTGWGFSRNWYVEELEVRVLAGNRKYQEHRDRFFQGRNKSIRNAQEADAQAIANTAETARRSLLNALDRKPRKNDIDW
jgi:hypothetical protein